MGDAAGHPASISEVDAGTEMVPAPESTLQTRAAGVASTHSGGPDFPPHGLLFHGIGTLHGRLSCTSATPAGVTVGCVEARRLAVMANFRKDVGWICPLRRHPENHSKSSNRKDRPPAAKTSNSSSHGRRANPYNRPSACRARQNPGTSIRCAEFSCRLIAAGLVGSFAADPGPALLPKTPSSVTKKNDMAGAVIQLKNVLQIDNRDAGPPTC